GIKRGILELADILAVTKADGANRQPADRARAELEAALRLLRPASEHWRPRVITVSARDRRGVAELWALVEEHRQTLEAAGELAERRRRQQLRWMWNTVEDELLLRLRRHPRVAAELPALEASVAAGEQTPTLAAERLLELFLDPSSRN
ncbi:MAG: methylmalonyl Co-A mutase-associated GTPase MeaB, partial [Acidobacteria bacterium]|nr:methylmalonyl Co-A mutase-associated GTPase MeaB [Acidobacteriota bacterium]